MRTLKIVSNASSLPLLFVLAGATFVALSPGFVGVAQLRPSQPTRQVSQVRAVHRNGQTFIAWNAIDPPGPDGEPSGEALIRLKRDTAKRLAYRIYRSPQPISAVAGLLPIGLAAPLSGWNTDYHGLDPAASLKPFRYAIEDGTAPLADGLGLYVHNPPSPGPAYYAVTAVVDGVENTSVMASNRTADAVVETVGAGTPVLQRVVRLKEFRYVKSPELRYYTRWEAPPNANRENQPIDYLVAIPPRVATPAYVGLHLHAYGGNLHGDFGWWFNADLGAILVSSNQVPYDWWTGYHELMGTTPGESTVNWTKGVVRPYTQNRLLSFVKWLATTRPIDLSRTFAAGNSMGGAGSVMLAIRRPHEIAWAVSWVGVHRPHMTPTFFRSYQGAYGPPEARVRFEDGTPVWEYFDDAVYLQRHPGEDIGFVTFSNGKNDNDIGWPQAVDFLRALQSARQPHLFVWGEQGHGQRAAMPAGGDERTMPLDIRTNRSLPAFTRSTLDDDPGNGEPNDGRPAGQVNLFLEWDPETVVDRPDRWEMTLGVTANAPAKEARADVTPRRLQGFKPVPGEIIVWTNSAGRTPLQTGEVVVDQHGLITITQVHMRAGRTRLTLERRPSSGR
jgi:hypothetical protein